MDRILDNLEITHNYYDQGYDQPNTRKSGDPSNEIGGNKGFARSNGVNRN